MDIGFMIVTPTTFHIIGTLFIAGGVGLYVKEKIREWRGRKKDVESEE